MPNLIVNVDVDDLDRGVKFYTRALALTLGRRFPSAVELLGAGAPIWLLLNAAETLPYAGASTQRTYQRHWTPVHLDFVVDDLEAAVQRAEHAGAVVERTISEHVWGHMALLSDPFGHGVCLLQFKGHGYDEITTDMD
jgi:predicted enzyme related to lactoylglutathione lyase